MTALSEAIKNAREAIELHFEALNEYPKPTKIDEHVNNPEFAGCVWTVVRVPEYRWLSFYATNVLVTNGDKC